MSVEELQEKRGCVATVCTTGDVKPEFSIGLSNMRDWNTRNGFVNVEYKIFDAKLVESGRDAAARHALEEGYDWILMIDADAGHWPPHALAQMLEGVYVRHDYIHVLGAYCQLKGEPNLPTIDTGTGKWEVQYPGQGIIPVIRTGGHFLLVKLEILKQFGPPWFRTRVPYTPAKAFMELDNFARTKLDGHNPLSEHPEWLTLMTEAKRVSVADEAATVAIGEDSGFCDQVQAAGGNIGVDTNLVVGHVGSKVIMPKDLRESIKTMDKKMYAAVGCVIMSRPKISFIINTASMDPLVASRGNMYRTASYGSRAQLLREEILPRVLQQGFDEVIVVGQFEAGEGYRYIEMPPIYRDRRDALHQRELGARHAKGDWLVFCHDDHAPKSGFKSGLLKNYRDDEWDLLVPKRIHNITRKELDNGREAGYMGGHCLVMQRSLWAVVPWTSVDTEYWDTSMSRIWREAGAEIIWVEDLTHMDMEAAECES